MPDYQFYQEVFCGWRIPQSKFRSCMARAKAWLDGLERCCTVVAYGPESRKMALCAIGEALYDHAKQGQYETVSLGGVSVRYEKNKASLQHRLLQSACGYLEIYRGVG